MAIKDEQIIEVFDAEGKLLPDAKIVQKQLRTISCDGEGCTKTITFDPRTGQQTVAANPWMQNVRIVQTGDNRVLAYCSDECIVKGATAGTMNLPTRKLIDIAEGTEAVKKAALQAEMQRAAEEAIRQGTR